MYYQFGQIQKYQVVRIRDIYTIHTYTQYDKMMEMEMNQENTYEPLEGRRRIESTDSPDMETTPPRDRNGILYIALIAAGIGFVLPYNR